MNISKSEYNKISKKHEGGSKMYKTVPKAFLFGGFICCIGQFFINLYKMLGVDEKTASTLASVTLILLSVLLTGLGLYQRIAKHAGAGTLVPITGFANAIAAPALEFRTEGYVLGTGAKMFIIAGPVIVYGTVASVVYGVIYWIISLFN